jgi:hypothetical protein
MRRAKSVIAFFLMVVLYLGVDWVEYDLVTRFGIMLSGCVTAFALLVLVGALVRAPAGYEDEKGFHFGVLADAVLP